jgi:putative transposase
MGTFELKCGTRFTYDGYLQEIVRRLPNNCICLAQVASGVEWSVAEDVLMQAACDGTLTLATTVGGTAAGAAPPRPAAGLDWADYPPHLRAIAEYRHMVILPLLGGRCSAGAVRARIGEVRAQWAGEGCGPAARTLLRTLSPASVYRWRRRYTASGNDIRALIPRTAERGGKGQRRLGAEEVEAIIGEVLRDGFTRNPYLPIKRLREEVGKRIVARNAARPGESPLRIPSWATIQRRVAALPPETVLAAKEGRRAARRQVRQVGEAAEPARPLERVEIDHLVIPVIAIDEHDNLPLGLPVLTYALDVATRYPLGYYLGFEPFSYYAVMECLYHAIRPKDAAVGACHGCAHAWLAYGVPRELFTDNG